MTTTTVTREAWLLEAAGMMRGEIFVPQSIVVPEVQLSVGFPVGVRAAIGQCFRSGAAADKRNHIYIHPKLDDFGALGVLVHELIHAADDCESGHRGPFRKMALAVGLEGKMTSTVPGPELTERLNKMMVQLGEYPHGVLDHHRRKKQSTRLLKAVCPECGYTVRVTRKWIDYGLPTCPCGTEMVTDS